ncbi:MAG: hypothetical protein K2V38_24605 [Gemmataceae bacterium]|nr:hypothetical protein [Gemmataceae bacterium]
MQTIAINPFFAARTRTASAPRQYAKLPLAPINASPVPRLTSLYHHDQAGPYGDRRYPGNCSGELIKDVLRYFRPVKILDPCSGSGTCRDVCRELDIACHALDIRYGQDACNPASFPRTTTFPLIWAHPPYWRMKRYTNDPRDLSAAPTLEAFLDRYGRFLGNCADVLEPGGILAVLMGDYSDRTEGFLPLTYHTLCGRPHKVHNVVQLVMWPRPCPINHFGL